MAEATLKGKVILDMSQFEKAVKKIEEISNNLNKTFSGIKMPDFKPAIKGVKKLEGNFESSTKSMKQNLKETEEQAKNLGDRLAEVGTAVVALKMGKALLNFAKDAIKTNADIKTTMKTMGVVFGETADDIEEFVQRSSDAMGASKRETRELAKGVGIMLRDIGLDKQGTTKLTKQMMVTAGILAQNTGYAMETVQDSIQSALMGNTMTMDKMGIELKESALEMTDAFKKLSGGRPFRQLDNDTQGLIRAFAIMEKTARNYGNELGTTLNAEIAKVGASFKNFNDNIKESMGEVLMPIVSVIANVAKAFEQLSEVFKALTPDTRRIIALFAMWAVGLPALIVLLKTAFSVLKMGIGSILSVAKSTKILGFLYTSTFMKIAGITLVGAIIISECFGGIANASKNMGAVVKSSFLYMAGSIIKAVSIIAKALQMLINLLSGKKVATFGDDLSGVGDKLIGQAGAIASGVREQGTARKALNKQMLTGEKVTDNLSNAQDKNAKSADKAGKANKKLLDNLQGFDEINKLQVDEDGAGGLDSIEAPEIDIPDLSGMGTDIGDINDTMGELSNKFELIQEKIKNLMPYIVGFGAVWAGFKIAKTLLPIIKLLSGLKIQILPIIAIVGGIVLVVKGVLDYLKDPSWANFAKILGGIVLIAGGLALIFGPIPALIAGVVLAIGAIGLAIYKNWDVIKEFFANLWGTITEFCSGVWEKLVEFFSRIWEGIKTSMQAIWAGVKTILEPVGNFIVNVFKTAWTIVEAVWKVASKYFEIVWKLIEIVFTVTIAFFKMVFTGAWEAVKFVWDKAKAFFSSVWEGIKTIFKPVIEFFKNAFGTAWNTIKGIWNTVKSYFLAVWNGIKAVFAPVIEFFKNVFSNAWNGIKNIFSAVGGFFTGVWNTIVNIFTGIGDRISSAIGGAFKATINGAFVMVERFVNGFIRGINRAIGIINNIPGVSIGYIGELSLPRLAKGGVVKSQPGGILANIGEGKYDEAVIPLGESSEFANLKAGIAEAVIGALGNGNGRTQRIEVDILAGGKYMQKQIIDMTNGVEEYAW